MNLLDKLNNYKREFKEIITEMENIKKQIDILNAQGQKLAAQANNAQGKISAIENLIKEKEEK